MLALLSLLAASGPNVIVFGGGWGPEGTQASIEVHVKALAAAVTPAEPTVLFAGGPSLKSVQVTAKRQNEVDALLGLVFDRRDHLQVEYRKKRVDGPKASKRALLAAITASASKSGLVILGAGHGASATEERPAALELWGPDDKLSVTELAEHLDGYRKGPVALVLGHCHSGAFTSVAYVGGRPPRLASPPRCVLAAVPAEREAAGCTPDVSDPSARAYMALIAEALAGEEADYDEDGAVSLAEAHAYARIHDQTVDVPVSSSETWLLKRLGARVPPPERIRLKRVLARARPPERAVIEKLEEGRLARSGSKKVAAELRQLDAQIEEASQKLGRVLDERDRLRRYLVDAVLARWPELVNPYHHQARALLAGDAAEVVTFVKGRSEYRELLRRDEEVTARDRQILSLEKRSARLERFVRAAQIIAGERMLSRRDRRTFDALVACEGMKPLVR